jgi:hypothetical protein
MTHKEIELQVSYGQPATIKIVEKGAKDRKGNALTRQPRAAFRIESGLLLTTEKPLKGRHSGLSFAQSRISVVVLCIRYSRKGNQP